MLERQVGLCGGDQMAYEEEAIVQEWLDHLKGLDVQVKKMFGCHRQFKILPISGKRDDNF